MGAGESGEKKPDGSPDAQAAPAEAPKVEPTPAAAAETAAAAPAPAAQTAPVAKPAAAAVPAAAAQLAPAQVEPAAADEAKTAANTAAAAASIAAPQAAPKAAAPAGNEDTKKDTPAAKSKGKSKGKTKDQQGARLCIKNLSEDMTQAQLKTLFEPFGTLGSISVKTKEDGKCRGFAFIAFATADEAAKAITAMHKKDIGGKQLSVSPAEQRQYQEGAEGGKGKGKGKGQEKGKGKGKGKDKGAAAPVPAQQAGYVAPYPYNQLGAQPAWYGAYPGNPYQQLMYQNNPAEAQQMQAAQLAQMQVMAQGMYLQAVQNQAQASAGAKPAIPPGPINPQVPATSSKEYIGELKSISSRHGYGFIKCEEVASMFPSGDGKGRDVYVSADLLPEGGQEMGSKLKFTVGQNSKGHPQARSCSLVA